MFRLHGIKELILNFNSRQHKMSGIVFASAPEGDELQSTCLRETIPRVEEYCECYSFGLKTPTILCKDCDENLCEKYVQTHKTSKATRQQLTKTIQATKKGHIVYCKHCVSAGKTTGAENFCDYLCDNCTLVQTRIKATKSHGEPKGRHLDRCEPCEGINEEAETAVMFSPVFNEKLCSNCSRSNSLQEMTKQTKKLKVIESREKDLHQRNNGLETHKLHDLKAEISGLSENCMKQKATKNASVEEKKKPEDRPTIKEGKENQEQSKKNFSKTTPGRPRASNVDADSLTLSWDKPSGFKDDDFFEVSFRNIDINGDWEILKDEFSIATGVVTGLKSKTLYVFRVRAVCDNEKGPYSEISKAAYTTTSPTLQLDMFSQIAEEGKPSPTKYILPITEIQNARNTKAKTRKFDVGRRVMGSFEEKTILVIGARGSGKSTLVDGIANHALGVKWEDQFRFTIVTTEEKEENQHSLAFSQTEWVNCYSIHPKQGRRHLPYRLNIIDTPGFYRSRRLNRDQTVVEQIRQFFTEKPPTGVCCIDAICFHINAQDEYCAATQRYIYQSVMSLFGKDIEKNICCFVTFANGNDKPVMSALLQSGLPFDKRFTFDNSSLFASNEKCFLLSHSVWKEGERSFQNFFNFLENNMETKSLQLTKNVLDERFWLETTVANLQPQLVRGLLKANEMRQEIQIIEQNESLIKDNKDFEYEVTEKSLKIKELALGLHVTNCTHCHFTCHENCGIPNDGGKSRCLAMVDGICTVCPNKCKWQKHANTPYVFKYVPVKVKKTYAEKEKKYQEASGKLLTQEQIMEKMGEELAELCEDIEDLKFIIKECNERLSDIALRPCPLTMTEHIDLMSEVEKIFSSDENFNKMIQSLMCPAGTRKNRIRDTRTIWQKMGSWFGWT